MTEAKALAYNLKKFANAKIFLVILIFLQFFFLLNGAQIFGDGWNPTWNYSILVYMSATAAFLIISQYEIKQIGIRDSIKLLFFGLFMMLIIILILRTQGLLQKQFVPGNTIFPMIIYQTVVVATSEEILFRGVVNSVCISILGKFWGIGLGSAAFALFHLSAYATLGFAPFALAFVFGILFSLAKELFGLPMAIGMHAGWNIPATGALYVISAMTL